jgi:ribose 5-phosphate isomerase A
MAMDDVKERIGTGAAGLVEDGMVIGLGTGSTAACFIQALAKRYEQEGLNIVTVSSSLSSERLARDLGLPTVLVDAIDSIDITFDGADEIDAKKQMIKGAGGALLKEKILASASKELIIMVDESKLVENLGKAKLPVEVVQFGHRFVEAKLAAFATKVTLRHHIESKPFVTDSSHFIYDLELKNPVTDAEELDKAIKSIPGVVSTGLFYKYTGRVIVGYKDKMIIRE